MSETNIRPTGIAWYKEEQWDRLLQISDDPEELETTFKEWEINTKNKIKEIEKQGGKYLKVEIDTEDLLFWCNSFRMPVNGRTRSEYISKRTRELLREKK